LRAKDLTQQLMTFAKGGEPIKQPASIAELLQEAASFALRGSNVRYECAIAKDLWPVEIDAGQISQVIHNLIINADQAMPGGGVIWIQAENLRVSTEGVEPGVPLHEGRYVKIAIIDQGIGIPKEHLPKIFDPYFTTKQGGSGLGLATTYAVIKKHGGYITTGSELGVGTTFRIYLPAAQRPIISRRDGAAPPQGGRGRILVMDDEETIRELVGDILSQIGYEAAFARDGDEAIERYKKARETGRPFAAVIMDLTIPGGMGGKEAIQQLRAIDPEVKGIVSSGYSNDPVMADFRAYGFMGVIAKPYRPSELSDVVHRVLLG
jgi:CheY-like chemotaxis protein